MDAHLRWGERVAVSACEARGWARALPPGRRRLGALTSGSVSRVRSRMARIACFDGATVEIAAMRTSFAVSSDMRRRSSDVMASPGCDGS